MRAQPIAEMPAPPAAPTTAERRARQAEARHLVERCQRGDREAFSDLYDRFSGLVLALCMRVLRDPSAAEEVLQETFLYAWQKADAYDPERSSVSTWLVLIARSRSIDRLRRSRHLARLRTLAGHETLTTIDPVAATAVLDDQRRARVSEAMSQLSPEQRTVVDLAYYGGLTQKQIAERMQIPLGTVKTRTHLAYRKLRAALEPELGQLLA